MERKAENTQTVQGTFLKINAPRRQTDDTLGQGRKHRFAVINIDIDINNNNYYYYSSLIAAGEVEASQKISQQLFLPTAPPVSALL